MCCRRGQYDSIVVSTSPFWCTCGPARAYIVYYVVTLLNVYNNMFSIRSHYCRLQRENVQSGFDETLNP